MQEYHTASDDTSMDFQYWLDYVADQQRYPAHHDDAAHTDYSPLQTVLRPCRNSDCTNSSYAIYCSEACRIVLEGLEEDATDFYSDGESVLLGNRQLSDTQHAADLAAGGFAAMVCGVQPQPVPVVPAVQPLPESPCSVNTYVELAGRHVQVTLRGVDEAEVLTRLEALLSRYPLPTKPPQPPPVEPGEGFCQTHSVQMTLNHAKPGQGKDWYSHKHAGHWCRGKA